MVKPYLKSHSQLDTVCLSVDFPPYWLGFWSYWPGKVGFIQWPTESTALIVEDVEPLWFQIENCSERTLAASILWKNWHQLVPPKGKLKTRKNIIVCTKIFLCPDQENIFIIHSALFSSHGSTPSRLSKFNGYFSRF